MTDDIKNGRETLMTEIAGLNALAESLGNEFVEAVSVIDTKICKGSGRLIVSGMGKSGHMARKMAATFASTGTPSQFVHPGEASHGDLGMITANDVVIAISNSGETAELADLIAYTRRFSIPLIAITKKANSALGQHCDILLQLPDVGEACPNGMAPTTSTTMTVALGDALAIALMHRTGLSAEDFGVWHPGGKLGQRLQYVSDLMDSGDELPVISDETMTMDKVIVEMTAKNKGCVIVINDDKSIAGFLTDGDLKRHMDKDLLSKTIGELMTHDPKTIKPTLLAVEAVDIMTNRFSQPITSLLVVDDQDRLCGLLRLQTCLAKGIV